MRRLKGVRYEKESEFLDRVIITMRKPRHQSLIRKIMFWANCYKWDMAMYRKLNDNG